MAAGGAPGGPGVCGDHLLPVPAPPAGGERRRLPGGEGPAGRRGAAHGLQGLAAAPPGDPCPHGQAPHVPLLPPPPRPLHQRGTGGDHGHGGLQEGQGGRQAPLLPWSTTTPSTSTPRRRPAGSPSSTAPASPAGGSSSPPSSRSPSWRCSPSTASPPSTSPCRQPVPGNVIISLQIL